MLVKNIPRDRLAYYCAKAQGWELVKQDPMKHRVPEWVWMKDGISIDYKWRYDPLTNGQQVYDLIVKFKIIVKPPNVDEYWSAGIIGMIWMIKGTDPAEAVMRVVCASKWGDEIPDDVYRGEK